MKFHLQVLQTLTQLKCNWHLTTLAAVSTGLGAAAGYKILPWYFLLLPLVMLYTLNRRQLILSLVLFISGIISGITHYHIDRYHRQTLPHHKTAITGTITCLDRRTTALNSVSGLRIVNSEIDTGETVFEAAVIYPDGERAFYGDRHRFSGMFYPSKEAGLICRDNQIAGAYPPLYGPRPLVIVKELHPDIPVDSPMRFFFICRDFLLKNLLSRIKNPIYADMAACLFFGAGRIPPVQMRNFVASGTIHLFSVSGLHVTLLAGIFLILLKPVPFCWRYRLTALLALFYVLCSGASLPAVRAGTMVIIWCLMRSMLLPSSGWDSMMLTWCIFALLDPESTGSLSAQYSFGITAALILMMKCFRKFFARQKHILSLMPPNAPLTRRRRKLYRRQRNLAMIPAVSTTAFFAGCGISFFRQNIFTPGSIPANLFLTLLTPLLFGAMIFKMFTGPFSALCDELGAMILEGTFYLLDNLTLITAQWFPMQYIPAPPLWSIILFYLFLFGSLGLHDAVKRKLCFLGMISIFFFWYLFPLPQHHSLLVISNGSDKPALIALTSPGGCTEIVDVPDRESGSLAGRILRSKGADNLRIHFSKANAGNISGLPALAGQFDNITVTDPPPGKRVPGKAFRRILKQSGFRLSQIPSPADLTTLSPDGLQWKNSAAGVTVNVSAADSGREIRVMTANGKVYRQILPWCSRPVIWECELK